MKCYVASKTRHAPVWRMLRDEGHRITSTWIDEAERGQTASYPELAVRCLHEIREADYLVLYCEDGEVLKGVLVEVGAALALGKPIFYVGSYDGLGTLFHHHPLWHHCEDLAAAMMPAKVEVATAPCRPAIGAAAVVCRDGHLLYEKRSGVRLHGLYAFPGGHVEYMETFADAAIRELREETGLVAESAKLITVEEHMLPGSNEHYVTAFMLMGGVTGEPAPDWWWYPIDNPPTPCVPVILKVLTEMRYSLNVAGES